MSQVGVLEPGYDVHGHAWAVSQRPAMHVPRWLLALGVAMVVAVAGVTGWAIGRAGTDTAGKAAPGVQSVPLKPAGHTSQVGPAFKGAAAGPASAKPVHAGANVNEIPCLITLRWGSSGYRTARVPC
jgi:hypothetical protein